MESQCDQPIAGHQTKQTAFAPHLDISRQEAHECIDGAQSSVTSHLSPSSDQCCDGGLPPLVPSPTRGPVEPGAFCPSILQRISEHAGAAASTQHIDQTTLTTHHNGNNIAQRPIGQGVPQRAAAVRAASAISDCLHRTCIPRKRKVDVILSNTPAPCDKLPPPKLPSMQRPPRHTGESPAGEQLPQEPHAHCCSVCRCAHNKSCYKHKERVGEYTCRKCYQYFHVYKTYKRSYGVRKPSVGTPRRRPEAAEEEYEDEGDRSQEEQADVSNIRATDGGPPKRRRLKRGSVPSPKCPEDAAKPGRSADRSSTLYSAGEPTSQRAGKVATTTAAAGIAACTAVTAAPYGEQEPTDTMRPLRPSKNPTTRAALYKDVEGRGASGVGMLEERGRGVVQAPATQPAAACTAADPAKPARCPNSVGGRPSSAKECAECGAVSAFKWCRYQFRRQSWFLCDICHQQRRFRAEGCQESSLGVPESAAAQCAPAAGQAPGHRKTAAQVDAAGGSEEGVQEGCAAPTFNPDQGDVGMRCAGEVPQPHAQMEPISGAAAEEELATLPTPTGAAAEPAPPPVVDASDRPARSSGVPCAWCGTTSRHPGGFESGDRTFACHGCCMANRWRLGFYGPPGSSSREDADRRRCAACGAIDSGTWYTHRLRPLLHTCAACEAEYDKYGKYETSDMASAARVAKSRGAGSKARGGLRRSGLTVVSLRRTVSTRPQRAASGRGAAVGGTLSAPAGASGAATAAESASTSASSEEDTSSASDGVSSSSLSSLDGLAAAEATDGAAAAEATAEVEAADGAAEGSDGAAGGAAEAEATAEADDSVAGASTTAAANSPLASHATPVEDVTAALDHRITDISPIAAASPVMMTTPRPAAAVLIPPNPPLDTTTCISCGSTGQTLGFVASGGRFTCHGCCNANRATRGFYGPLGADSLPAAGGRGCAVCGAHLPPGSSTVHATRRGLYTCRPCHDVYRRTGRYSNAPPAPPSPGVLLSSTVLLDEELPPPSPDVWSGGGESGIGELDVGEVGRVVEPMLEDAPDHLPILMPQSRSPLDATPLAVFQEVLNTPRTSGAAAAQELQRLAVAAAMQGISLPSEAAVSRDAHLREGPEQRSAHFGQGRGVEQQAPTPPRHQDQAEPQCLVPERCPIGEEEPTRHASPSHPQPQPHVHSEPHEPSRQGNGTPSATTANGPSPPNGMSVRPILKTKAGRPLTASKRVRWDSALGEEAPSRYDAATCHAALQTPERPFKVRLTFNRSRRRVEVLERDELVTGSAGGDLGDGDVGQEEGDEAAAHDTAHGGAVEGHPMGLTEHGGMGTCGRNGHAYPISDSVRCEVETDPNRMWRDSHPDGGTSGPKSPTAVDGRAAVSGVARSGLITNEQPINNASTDVSSSSGGSSGPRTGSGVASGEPAQLPGPPSVLARAERWLAPPGATTAPAVDRHSPTGFEDADAAPLLGTLQHNHYQHNQQQQQQQQQHHHHHHHQQHNHHHQQQQRAQPAPGSDRDVWDREAFTGQEPEAEATAVAAAAVAAADGAAISGRGHDREGEVDGRGGVAAPTSLGHVEAAGEGPWTVVGFDVAGPVREFVHQLMVTCGALLELEDHYGMRLLDAVRLGLRPPSPSQPPLPQTHSAPQAPPPPPPPPEPTTSSAAAAAAPGAAPGPSTAVRDEDTTTTATAGGSGSGTAAAAAAAAVEAAATASSTPDAAPPRNAMRLAYERLCGPDASLRSKYLADVLMRWLQTHAWSSPLTQLLGPTADRMRLDAVGPLPELDEQNQNVWDNSRRHLYDRFVAISTAAAAEAATIAASVSNNPDPHIMRSTSAALSDPRVTPPAVSRFHDAAGALAASMAKHLLGLPTLPSVISALTAWRLRANGIPPPRGGQPPPQPSPLPPPVADATADGSPATGGCSATSCAYAAASLHLRSLAAAALRLALVIGAAPGCLALRLAHPGDPIPPGARGGRDLQLGGRRDPPVDGTHHGDGNGRTSEGVGAGAANAQCAGSGHPAAVVPIFASEWMVVRNSDGGRSDMLPRCVVSSHGELFHPSRGLAGRGSEGAGAGASGSAGGGCRGGGAGGADARCGAAEVEGVVLWVKAPGVVDRRGLGVRGVQGNGAGGEVGGAGGLSGHVGGVGAGRAAPQGTYVEEVPILPVMVVACGRGGDGGE